MTVTTTRPGKRHKIHGVIDEWPYVRLYPDDMECEAELLPGLWPDDTPTEDGTPFTLHYRGTKFLYVYVIRGPRITRSQMKRARIRARAWAKLFNWGET